jgi:hypothetical protein
MKNEEQQKLDPRTIRNAHPFPGWQSWPAESDERDKLSPSELMREPRLSDGDLFHGDVS